MLRKSGQEDSGRGRTHTHFAQGFSDNYDGMEVVCGKWADVYVVIEVDPN